MTAQEAIEIITKYDKCISDDCPVTVGCGVCPYFTTVKESKEAVEMAIEALQMFQTFVSGISDLVSRQYLLDEYDRQHQGPPGGARKIIADAPPVVIHNIPVDQEADE